VGIDPPKDLRRVNGRGADAKDVFASGSADAFMGFAQDWRFLNEVKRELKA
jgi:hypothetical protein